MINKFVMNNEIYVYWMVMKSFPTLNNNLFIKHGKIKGEKSDLFDCKDEKRLFVVYDTPRIAKD